MVVFIADSFAPQASNSRRRQIPVYRFKVVMKTFDHALSEMAVALHASGAVFSIARTIDDNEAILY